MNLPALDPQIDITDRDKPLELLGQLSRFENRVFGHRKSVS
jgi:hypothetical protein